MSVIDAPLFFQKNKAEELNDTIFDNTGCFVFLKIEDFPFMNSCENYRQALYSLIIDYYVLFHDCGRAFCTAFAKVSNTFMPPVLENLKKYRGLLAHAQFEPEIKAMDSFARLLTSNGIQSIEDFYLKLSNADDGDYKSAYNALKNELDIFYNALARVKNRCIKKCFCNYRPYNNNLNVFKISLNQALIKSILQAKSGNERPTYLSGRVIYCQNGKVEINSFITAQQSIINEFNNNQYNTPDEIYPDFRNKVINIVHPPQQPSAQLLNNP